MSLSPAPLAAITLSVSESEWVSFDMLVVYQLLILQALYPLILLNKMKYSPSWLLRLSLWPYDFLWLFCRFSWSFFCFLWLFFSFSLGNSSFFSFQAVFFLFPFFSFFFFSSFQCNISYPSKLVYTIHLMSLKFLLFVGVWAPRWWRPGGKD